jgi:hypothetical protein
MSVFPCACARAFVPLKPWTSPPEQIPPPGDSQNRLDASDWEQLGEDSTARGGAAFVDGGHPPAAAGRAPLPINYDIHARVAFSFPDKAKPAAEQARPPDGAAASTSLTNRRVAAQAGPAFTARIRRHARRRRAAGVRPSSATQVSDAAPQRHRARKQASGGSGTVEEKKTRTVR